LADHDTASTNFQLSLFDTTNTKHLFHHCFFHTAHATVISISLCYTSTTHKHAPIFIRTAHHRSKAATRNFIASLSIIIPLTLKTPAHYRKYEH
jgi:hypothetical protein